MTDTQTIAPLTAAEYHATPGLSNSGMKDLAVSPLRFWFRHVNPNRELEQPTPEMILGTALHCAVLEPDQFDARYACELNPPADALDTIDEMRQWLKDHGRTPKGTLKKDIVFQVLEADPNACIISVQKELHLKANAGKIILPIDAWNRVSGMTEALVTEPRIDELLKEGRAEVPLFAQDADTGAPLKCKLDWMTKSRTVDLKTFTQKRGKSIDKSVTEAIWYEGYLRQAWFYSMMRALVDGDKKASGPQTAPEFVIAFVESDEPHEVRIRTLRPKTAGSPNLFWERARVECRHLIRVYADCVKQFGDKPWRSAQDIDPLADEELPGLAY